MVTGAQRDLATAQAHLSAARAFLHTEVATCWTAAAAGTPGPVEDGARLRLACAHAAAQHTMVSRRLLETYGKVRLGVPTDTTRL